MAIRFSHYGQVRPVSTKNDEGFRHPTTVLNFPRNNRCKQHPTEKPTALCEWLVKTYSNEGDTILDPFMGSGSVGKAANNTGRNFIGMENHEPYYLSAVEMISGSDRSATSCR